MSGIIDDAGRPKMMGRFEGINWDILGPRCPFCGAAWSDRRTCGEGPGSWKVQASRRKEKEGRT